MIRLDFSSNRSSHTEDNDSWAFLFDGGSQRPRTGVVQVSYFEYFPTAAAKRSGSKSLGSRKGRQVLLIGER